MAGQNAIKCNAFMMAVQSETIMTCYPVECAKTSTVQAGLYTVCADSFVRTGHPARDRKWQQGI